MYTLLKTKTKPKTKAPRLTRTLLEERAKGMRQDVNKLELTALNLLKTNNIPFKHQVVFGFYILDFLITDRCLVVEIDGSSHLHRSAKDEKRDTFCNQCGLQVLRLVEGEENTIIERIQDYPSVAFGLRSSMASVEMAESRREAANRSRAKKAKIKNTRKRK